MNRQGGFSCLIYWSSIERHCHVHGLSSCGLKYIVAWSQANSYPYVINDPVVFYLLAVASPIADYILTFQWQMY
ncbi:MULTISPECIES: hypothetical protein [Colwellia]|uniref:hypothetical protein n=1 Tax=Colwellia TaxID=28228 RepID=UPI00118157B7|nr:MULTISPECIES: hypothetical protein [Colwellia]